MSSQTRGLYSDSKTRLCQRIAANIQSCGSVIRQIIKGSRSVETLSYSARSFAAQESTIANTASNINKLQISSKQFQMQLENINKSCAQIDDLVQRFQ